MGGSPSRTGCSCSGGGVLDGQRQSFPVEVQKAEGMRVCEHSVGNKKEPSTS